MSGPGDLGRVWCLTYAFERVLATGGNSREAQIDRMAVAIFDERCPGIRPSAADYPLYRAAAVAALVSLGVIEAGP